MFRGLWIASGLAGKVGGLVSGAAGLFSVKYLVIATALAFVGLTTALHFEHKRAVEEHDQLTGIAAGVAAQVGVDKLEPTQVVATISTVVANYHTAQRERDGFMGAADRQSKANALLAQQTATAKAQADRASLVAARVSASRDQWIAKAQAASTNPVRSADADELRKTEEALDAVYANGF